LSGAWPDLLLDRRLPRVRAQAPAGRRAAVSRRRPVMFSLADTRPVAA